MKMKIFLAVITVVVAVFVSNNLTAIKLGISFMSFPPQTQKAYAKMMEKVETTGDPAEAMMREWEITDEDLEEDDIFMEIESLANDYDMRYVGEKDMFRIENPKPNQVAHARIAEVCSLTIAKKMLDHSRFYGGFMPCRILYVEYGDGRRYLISMDMDLAIYGGTEKKVISPELMEDMLNVKKAMEEIPALAAGYDI